MRLAFPQHPLKEKGFMRTHPASRSFKPALEALEGRELPSGLLPTLQNLNSNLNTSANNFLTDQAVLAGYQTNQPSGGSTTVGQQYLKTTVDYQQMISDQFAIQQTGAADINFVNFASFLFAAQTGNSSAYFATVFFVDPLFQNVIDSANNTIGNASAQANQTYNFSPLPIGSLPSIASQTAVS
jgi:hypothetical protein